MPDMVIMQVQVPIERAKENLERMRREVSPPPKVIIATMLEEPRYVREMMSVGARAYSRRSAPLSSFRVESRMELEGAHRLDEHVGVVGKGLARRSNSPVFPERASTRRAGSRRASPPSPSWTAAPP